VAKKKPKRPSKRARVSFNDYVLVVEDHDGKELAVVEQTDRSRAPLVGEEVQLRAHVVKEKPHLAGAYVVQRVAHLPPPWAPVTINKYTLPWCYARSVASTVARDQSAATSPRVSLEPLPGDMDQTTAAEVARKSRDLATDLDDMADELAVAFHGGAAGELDRKLVERLSEASRRAKQVSLSALFRAKIPGRSK
jgi:hypothetical protein